MNQHYKNLTIEDVQLDMDNPRIAKYIEMYNKETLNSEQVALALGSGVEDSGQTNYNSLYNSIKTKNITYLKNFISKKFKIIWK